MKTSSLEFLKRILDIPAPSGFEAPAAREWRREAETFTPHVAADVSGNSTATIQPDGTPRIMLAGHIDEIGLMLVHIDEEGFLYFQAIGGWDSQVLVGQRVTIAGRNGPVAGVIGKVAIHLQKTEDKEKVSKIRDLWIDIGAGDRAEAETRVRVGDPAVLDAPARTLTGNRLVSRAIDNRIGAFVVLETLRALQDGPLSSAVTAVATAQEEIGWSGGGAKTSAEALKPRVAIVVDVSHATDHPGVEKKEVGEVKIGGGPVLVRGSAVNAAVFDLLADTAETEGIPYRVVAAPKNTGTDADTIYTAHHGIATGLVAVPNRYMHSPNEMVDIADVDATVALLTAFVRRLTPDLDFIPR